MLRDYIRTVAEKLKHGTKVYLCPACMETVIVAKILAREYSVVPTGFCDNDVRKQGENLNTLPSIKIFSFEEALLDPGSAFFVVSPHHSADMIGDLVMKRKVSGDRIINYQEIEVRYTCARFAQNWIIHEDSFVCCCIEGSKPRFTNQGKDPQKGIEYLDLTRNGLLNGDIPLPEVCQDCYNCKACYIYTSRKLNSFNFSFRGWCNYKCEYCSAHQPELKNYDDRFSLVPYLSEMEKRDMVNDIFSVLFAVGEPCLNEKRFTLYEHCQEKQYFLDVFSNCSIFDQKLFDLAHHTPVIIRKSFDAGTPETYRKIKGVDYYQKVLENVRHYLQAPYLALNPKYLFVPGINDNEPDIENFVQMCREMNVDFVTPVFSILDDKYSHSKHTKKMFKLLVDELAANGIFTANVDTLYSENYHKQYSESF